MTFLIVPPPRLTKVTLPLQSWCYICKQKYDSYYSRAIKEKYPRLHSTEKQFWVGVTMVTWKSVTLQHCNNTILYCQLALCVALFALQLPRNLIPNTLYKCRIINYICLCSPAPRLCRTEARSRAQGPMFVPQANISNCGANFIAHQTINCNSYKSGHNNNK